MGHCFIPVTENVTVRRPSPHDTPELFHPEASEMSVLNTNSGSLLGPNTIKTTMKTMNRTMCKIPPAISKVSSTFRNQRLKMNGTTMVAIMMRLVCQRSGWYASLLKAAKDVMILARIEGGPPQAKHHAAVVIHPVSMLGFRLFRA
jgi:hypothetical protein